jgi:transketolase
MMSIAAGLAAAGMVPFASSFAMFAVGRAYEQIRNSIGYPHLNVKICASHAGISVGEDGASHQCLEDIELMRGIPGMVVMCPADYVEAKACVRAAVEHNGPVYIRFGRAPVPVVFGDDYKFEIGKGSVIREGKDVSIIANGLCVASALEAAEMLAKDGIDAAEAGREFEEKATGLENAARRGIVDRVVNFADARKYLIAGFDMLFEKSEGNYKKHTTK